MITEDAENTGSGFLIVLRSVRFGHTSVPFVQQAPAIKFLQKSAALNVKAFGRQRAIASARAERFQHMFLFRIFETLGGLSRHLLSIRQTQDLPNLCRPHWPRR